MNKWNNGKVQPINSGNYIIIGISMKGNILEEDADYDSDDGWQIGNNWTILCWRKKQRRN